MRTALFVTIIACALTGATAAHAEPTRTPAEVARADIKATLGQVPSFFDAYPADGLPAWWEEIKDFQLSPRTALSVKMKELIGLAVASQIPCDYCIYFHTGAAALHGASAQEQKEAVAMAAITRHFSTVLNGHDLSFDEFKREVDRIVAHLSQGKSRPGPIASITDARAARADMTRTLGLVPGFLDRFPDAGLPAAWKQLRTVQLNPKTALAGKDKELIGLAVAAQVPCRFCVHFHTVAARLQGASNEEIKEAVAMAAVTRLGSTVLNGGQVDRTTFRREFDAIMTRAKRAAAR